jgi:hypothetical protein
MLSFRTSAVQGREHVRAWEASGPPGPEVSWVSPISPFLHGGQSRALAAAPTWLWPLVIPERVSHDEAWAQEGALTRSTAPVWVGSLRCRGVGDANADPLGGTVITMAVMNLRLAGDPSHPSLVGWPRHV